VKSTTQKRRKKMRDGHRNRCALPATSREGKGKAIYLDEAHPLGEEIRSILLDEYLAAVEAHPGRHVPAAPLLRVEGRHEEEDFEVDGRVGAEVHSEGRVVVRARQRPVEGVVLLDRHLRRVFVVVEEGWFVCTRVCDGGEGRVGRVGGATELPPCPPRWLRCGVFSTPAKLQLVLLTSFGSLVHTACTVFTTSPSSLTGKLTKFECFLITCKVAGKSKEEE